MVRKAHSDRKIGYIIGIAGFVSAFFVYVFQCSYNKSEIFSYFKLFIVIKNKIYEKTHKRRIY